MGSGGYRIASSLDMFVNLAEASDVCPDVAGTSTVIMARVKIAPKRASRFSGRSLGRVPASARGGSAGRALPSAGSMPGRRVGATTSAFSPKNNAA